MIEIYIELNYKCVNKLVDITIEILDRYELKNNKITFLVFTTSDEIDCMILNKYPNKYKIKICDNKLIILDISFNYIIHVLQDIVYKLQSKYCTKIFKNDIISKAISLNNSYRNFDYDEVTMDIVNEIQSSNYFREYRKLISRFVDIGLDVLSKPHSSREMYLISLFPNILEKMSYDEKLELLFKLSDMVKGEEFEEWLKVREELSIFQKI